MPHPADYLPRLQEGAWFAQLPPDFRQRLLEAAVLLPLAAGQRLFSRHDASADLYAVLQGSVRISAHGGLPEEGREALLAVIEAPQWFGEIAFIDGGPRTHDAHAAADSLLLRVPQARLQAILAEQPIYWRELAVLASRKLRTTFEAIEDATLMPVPRRIARRLAWLAEGFGASRTNAAPLLAVKVSQEQLSAMLGLSRQTVNQALGGLAEAGLITLARGRVAIPDLARLKRYMVGETF